MVICSPGSKCPALVRIRSQLLLLLVVVVVGEFDEPLLKWFRHLNFYFRHLYLNEMIDFRIKMGCQLLRY